MKLIETKTHWIPMQPHGVIPFPEDGDIEAAAKRALKLGGIPGPYPDIKYIVHHNVDHSKSIVFELMP